MKNLPELIKKISNEDIHYQFVEFTLLDAQKYFDKISDLTGDKGSAILLIEELSEYLQALGRLLESDNEENFIHVEEEFVDVMCSLYIFYQNHWDEEYSVPYIEFAGWDHSIFFLESNGIRNEKHIKCHFYNALDQISKSINVLSKYLRGHKDIIEPECDYISKAIRNIIVCLVNGMYTLKFVRADLRKILYLKTSRTKTRLETGVYNEETI